MKRLLFTLLLCLPCALQAQYIEVGIGGGVSVYSGDLSSSSKLNMLADGGGVLELSGSLNFGGAYSVKLNFMRTRVGAEDRYGDLNTGRRLNFSSPITEFSIMGEINPIQLFGKAEPDIYPFFMAGFGAFHFDPVADYRGFEVHLRTLGTEGQGMPGKPDFYRPWSLVLPMGIGFKIRLDDAITLSGSLSHRIAFTDYLDDISGREVNYLEILENNGKLAARLSQPNLDPESPRAVTYRRGGEQRDGYYLAMININYVWGGKKAITAAKNKQRNLPGYRCRKF